MSQHFDLTIDATSRSVVLRTPHLSVRSNWNEVRELIGRLFSSGQIKTAVIDRLRGMATLRFDSPEGTVGLIPDRSRPLRIVAQALRQPASGSQLLNNAYESCVNLVVHKTCDSITAGSIVSQLPGRVRLRHPLLRGSAALALRAERELSALQDVATVTASPLTGSVLVLLRPGAVSATQLLTHLERAVCRTECEPQGAVLAGPPVSHWIGAGVCLGLAVTSELFVPGAAPVTATALVVNNVSTLGRGLVELGTFKWRVASLYTVIMGTTLVSGQFLAAALMQASMTAWHAWTTHRLRKFVRKLESDQFLDALSESDEKDISFGRQVGVRIVPGSVVRIPVGAILPFDGVVAEGEGIVDERGMCGRTGAATVRTGDRIFAGSTVVRGQLAVRVNAIKSRTRLSSVRRTVHSVICEAVGEGGATPRANAVASNFVPFTFATGTAALLAGDVTTLAAVLRPDFCTGPSLNDRMRALTGVSHLLNEGWLVRTCESLHRLVRSRVIVIASIAPNHETSMAEECSRSKIMVEIHAGKIPSTSHSFERHFINGSSAGCIEYVRALRKDHQDVAVVSCQAILSELAGDDIVRISITPELCLDRPHADIVALHSCPHRLDDLLRVLHQAFEPGRSAWSVVLTCNALAISGAFLVGLTSLHVVALTNVGALAAGLLYQRHVKRSDELMASHGLRKRTSSDEIFAIAPGEHSSSPNVLAVPELTEIRTSPAMGLVVPSDRWIEIERNAPERRAVAISDIREAEFRQFDEECPVLTETAS